MKAARKGSVGIVRKLVQHGASMNLTNKVNNISFQSVITVTCRCKMSRDYMLSFPILLVLELASADFPGFTFPSRVAINFHP